MALSVLRKNTDKEEYIIRGPMGIWPFPILNTIIIVLNTIINIQQRTVETRPRARTYNIVRDSQGRIISIEELWVE